LETGNEGFSEQDFLSDKCYHPRAALKKAIIEWLPEFFKVKEAPQRIISKPQPSVASKYVIFFSTHSVKS
jgi:hypothetical protein